MADNHAIADRLREIADRIEADETPEGWEECPAGGLDSDYGPYKQVGTHDFVNLYVDADGDLWAANGEDSSAFISSEIGKLNNARAEAKRHF